jgi:hypothetical protein
MHILENIPTFWSQFWIVLLIIVVVVSVLVTLAIVVARRSKDGTGTPAFAALMTAVAVVVIVGLGGGGPASTPDYLGIAGEHLQHQAKEQYGISLTKVEAQKLVDPEHYKTASVKCDYNYPSETRPSPCDDVFEDRDNPDSNYHRFGHVQIATIKGEKVNLTSIELVRLNDEYRLAYYGKNSEKNTIRELPHL